MEKLNEIKQVLGIYKLYLLQKRNVIAVGIGYKKMKGMRTGMLCIICSVTEKKPMTQMLNEDGIPHEDWIPPVLAYHNLTSITDVVETGEIKALQDPKLRHRPVPGAVSIGHIHITAGTNACAVKKKEKLYFLSNNHVLANCNKAKKGDTILQPGAHDGGQNLSNKVAELHDFVPIVFEGGQPNEGCLFGVILNKFKRKSIESSGINKVDCAIAKPLNEEEVRDDIFWAGKAEGMAEAELIMGVKKGGRTTKYTEGVVEQISATVRVGFGDGKVAVFEDQIITSPMSQPGDSGSLVMNMKNEAVGLLFAGSTEVTICNRIQDVFNSLQLDDFY